MEDLSAFVQELAAKSAEKWTGGFLFEKGFRDSKRFVRYCGKLEDRIRTYLISALANYNEGDEWAKLSLCDMIRDFFVFAIKETDATDVNSDWRNLLRPLPKCEAMDFKNADEIVKRGWYIALGDNDTWSNLWFAPCYRQACFQYLHSVYIQREEIIDENNFCVKALPETLNDAMTLIKLLLDTIWVDAYSTIIWANQERVGDVLQTEAQQKIIDELTKTNKELTDKLSDVCDKQLPSWEQRFAELKQSEEANVQAALNDQRVKYNSELAAERKRAKNAEAELERLKAKYQELEEQLQMLDEADNDEDETAPTTALDYNSKIVFIAAPPPNSRIEGTYKRLMQKFPCSRFIYTVDDINPDADCYVMLTRYMKHHSLYNASCDLLRRRKYPYIHSAGQNVERIANDIFSKTRYTDNK